MSVQDERDLRDSLTGLLESVTPHPAPVAGAVRHGMRIRIRRWVSAVAAIAIIAAGAGFTPALLHARPATPPAAPHYKVTLQLLPSVARAGVVAAGVTNGRHWKVVMSGSHRTPSFQVIGRVGLGTIITEPLPTVSPVSTDSSSASNDRGFSSIVGTVSPDVAFVTVSLPNGDLLRLTPVLWKGARWIGLVLPGEVPIIRAVAYSADGAALFYSVPFDNIQLNVWWRPGETGPGRVIKTVGSGVVDGHRWKMTAAFGPWGYCYVFADGSACSDSITNPQQLQASKLIQGFTCEPIVGNTQAGPFYGVATVALDVARVVLKYSDGSSASFRSVLLDGIRSVGYSIPKNLKVVRSVAYSSSGTVIGSTSGEPMTC